MTHLPNQDHPGARRKEAADFLVAHEVLRVFCRRLLGRAGLIAADAELVADSLVEANLRGTDSHGVARLPHYLSRLAHGSIKAKPALFFVRLAPACGRVDGDHGLGQLVMARAAREAITLAGEAGAGWVAVQNSSHCGALSYFGLQMAEAGMIGFVFTHVDPMVLAHGSRAPFCGTNPICITAPGGHHPALCLDMATSIVPWNRVANAALTRKGIPRGWAVDQNGQDTCDASAVGALYPVGEHKGSGLALAIDVLCAFLGGAPFGPDIAKMYGDLTQKRKLGGLLGAIDVRRFLPLDQFQSRLHELLTRWGALPPRQPGAQVLFPGEPELRMKERRLQEGIPLPRAVAQQLDQLGREMLGEALVRQSNEPSEPAA